MLKLQIASSRSHFSQKINEILKVVVAIRTILLGISTNVSRLKQEPGPKDNAFAHFTRAETERS